jgi:hypothetical protein
MDMDCFKFVYPILVKINRKFGPLQFDIRGSNNYFHGYRAEHLPVVSICGGGPAILIACMQALCLVMYRMPLAGH